LPPELIVIRKRLAFLLAACAFCLVILTGRVAWIQFVRAEELGERALEVRTRDIPVEAKRGNIYDRNGKELVTNVSVDSVYAIPALVRDPRNAARKLSPLLNVDEERLYAILTRKSCFEWLARKLDAPTAARVKAENLPGIFFVEENRRHYPFQTLAPQVLGFTGIDNQGLTGIEVTFEKELKGTPGRIIIEQDATGQEIPAPVHQYISPRQGNHLYLTIDETIQHFVERELDKVVARYDPRLAVIIVMDPRTGEILAMGSRPTFNSNDWASAPREAWDRNPAIWYNYEPGSTFKIVTASAALAEGVVKPQDAFYDPGYIKVADRYIRCWYDGGHGSQTFAEVVMNSCNPGFVEVGLRVGIQKFYQYVKAFGFGEPTGIDLPGEAAGILIPEKKATNLNIATMAIGQSIAVTPIQLLTAVAAVANGGTLLKPQIVREIRDSSGNLVKGFEPVPVRRVLSPEVAREVGGLLESVVQKGTGRNAFIEGYRVAGKTGTAQVVGEGGGYVTGRYVASFAGFAPVEDPRVAALVMVAEPKGGIYYGSQVAAPVFAAVVRDTLHYLRVPPVPGLKKPKDPFVYEEPRFKVKVPAVVNYPVDEAISRLVQAGLTYRTYGEGSIVYAQTPEPGVEVQNGTAVILNLEPPVRGSSGEVTVPNLSGLTNGEAAELLKNMDLHLEPAGSGLAAAQDPPPGSRVPRGTIIKVQFVPPGLGTERPGPAAGEEAPPAVRFPAEGEFLERP
jgi:stage V sporulation protein D (sporulation-specific penicillin-binding protein)